MTDIGLIAIGAGIAVLTGANAIFKDLGVSLDAVKLSDLGTAKKVTIDTENTTIIDGAGSKSAKDKAPAAASAAGGAPAAGAAASAGAAGRGVGSTTIAGAVASATGAAALPSVPAIAAGRRS